ncbi:MAG: E3 binding domain-containing protein, partial [Alphaproteobacteria bacterium]|nr:E3 binding domain-containing protein [Alphaproteobacteria bacterium]
MGRFVFKLPDVGEGTAEAEIVAWHVAVGDTIKEDQHLVDVMTDKATVEMTSPVAGKVVELHGEPGSMHPVGAPIVIFEVEGAGNEKEAKTNGAAAAAKTAKTAPPPPPKLEEKKPAPKLEPVVAKPAPAPVAPATPRKFGDKPLASPAVRQRAAELGVHLQYIHGTGPAGRISHADL